MALRKWTCRWRGILAGFAFVASIAPNAFAQQSASSPEPPISIEQGITIKAAPHSLGLDDLTRLALEYNPKLNQAAFAVEAARGRADQAGRYPNPVLSVEGMEISDRTGPGGIWSAPFFTQEIVTARKLRLAQEAASRDIGQAVLQLRAQRFALLTAVRQGYFEILVLQRKIEILGELLPVAERAVENRRKLLESRQISRLDLVQTELEAEKIRTEREAALRELPAAFRRLAIAAGVPDLPQMPLVGKLDAPLPEYDLEIAASVVRQNHPEVQMARLGMEKAQFLMRRAEAERRPNVTVGAGFIRQNQNRSNDWGVTVSLPVPVWNRNQGNIHAAQAQMGDAASEVTRVENDLVDRLAAAHRDYASARERAERYRTAILPRAAEQRDLSVQAFRSGQIDNVKLLIAYQAATEAMLDSIKAQGDAWKAASVIAGLLLEDLWPLVPPLK